MELTVKENAVKDGVLVLTLVEVRVSIDRNTKRGTKRLVTRYEPTNQEEFKIGVPLIPGKVIPEDVYSITEVKDMLNQYVFAVEWALDEAEEAEEKPKDKGEW